MLKNLVPEKIISEIDGWVIKYPSNQKQSAILPALLILQKNNQGFLTNELIEAAAAYLDMPSIAAYEVASFYSMYELEPIGKHKISICTNISCLLNGSSKIVKQFEKRCQTKLGETSADRKYTLREVECMGACIAAPMFEYNEKYYEKQTVESVDRFVDELE